MANNGVQPDIEYVITPLIFAPASSTSSRRLARQLWARRRPRRRPRVLARARGCADRRRELSAGHALRALGEDEVIPTATVLQVGASSDDAMPALGLRTGYDATFPPTRLLLLAYCCWSSRRSQGKPAIGATKRAKRG